MALGAETRLDLVDRHSDQVGVNLHLDQAVEEEALLDLVDRHSDQAEANPHLDQVVLRLDQVVLHLDQAEANLHLDQVGVNPHLVADNQLLVEVDSFPSTN